EAHRSTPCGKEVDRGTGSGLDCHGHRRLLMTVKLSRQSVGPCTKGFAVRHLVILLFLGVTVGLIQGSATPAGEKGQPPQVKPKDGPPKGGKEGAPKKEPEAPNEPKDLVIKAKITKNDPLDTVRKDSHCKVHTLKLLSGYAYVIDMKADPHPDKDMP